MKRIQNIKSIFSIKKKNSPVKRLGYDIPGKIYMNAIPLQTFLKPITI